ncbi:RCC1 domain-containing protein [Brevibacillus migulae]|uniref:RCC1 domain-containing protein n=1 Tax=Brevibacillus migulae TaxID=1644114 RepID=UPI001431242B|nr:hypothetical protein [Brevibacillus migulae]
MTKIFQLFSYVSLLLILILSGCIGSSNAEIERPSINQDPDKVQEHVSKFKAVSAGYNHTLAVDEKGNIWAWGSNEYGQLGNGGTADSNVPTKIENFSKVVAVAGGATHSLALREDGTVWSWGANQFGELGNGTHNDSFVPVQVKGIDQIVAIDANANNSIALKKDGTVWVWGSNVNGQLGVEGDHPDTPLQVAGLENIDKVSCGLSFCLALQKETGTVWAWGWNRDTNLGVGSNEEIVHSPKKVTIITDINDIAGANGSIIALKKDGSIWEWGNGVQPEKISEAGTAISIGRGTNHYFSIQNSGQLSSWGFNDKGQLGTGVNVSDYVSLQNVKGITNVISISGGETHSVALDKEGTVWTWGSNEYGQLGDGTNTDKSIPEKLTIKETQ